MAKVFFTKDISPEGLQRVYQALGVDLKGKIGVKVSTGEKGAKGYLKADLIGDHFDNYDGFVNLAHGKGHAMGGFGANLKNQSIGFASRDGKAYIHSCGKTKSPTMCWVSKDPGAEQLKERIDSRLGREILSYAESLGLGSCKYELVEV